MMGASLAGRRARAELVMVGHRCAVAGLACLAGALVTVVLLVVAALLGGVAGLVAGGVALVLFAGLWGALPLALRHRALRAAHPPVADRP